MTETPTTKAELLSSIDTTQATWEALVADVSADRMEQPGVSGDWTFKDVVAHLNGWRTRTVDRLEAASRGETPPEPSWPGDLDDHSPEGTDAINEWIYEQGRGRTAAELIAASHEQYRRMRAAVEAVSEEDLLAPGRFSWLGEYPLRAVIDGSFEHLFVDHEPEIRAWIDSGQ